MSTLLVAFASMLGFIVAYHTYGRWLGQKLFGLRADALVPSSSLRDDKDFVPTSRSVLFGHHFTSIAGTGPIVGPALAVFWGWLPALLWVVFGSILIGGVHDLAALVISVRNRGQTVGEVAGRLISPRARLLFLAVLALALWVVLAIFGLVIARIFSMYPESVLSVWIGMPVAVAIGWWCYKCGGQLLIPSLISLAILYGAVWVGAYYLPLDIARILPAPETVGETWAPYMTPVVVWTLILLAYGFAASVLPVWLLLQPRDYVNSHQLMVALALLIAGLGAASLSGEADLFAAAPAIAGEGSLPTDAKPMFPFLFITIACGACSGFHCLVSSGTSSKQLAKETDAVMVGYGSMLMEGALAVLVILACCAGLGMQRVDRVVEGNKVQFIPRVDAQGEPVRGHAAWESYYRLSAEGKGFQAFGLGPTIAAFVDGGANFLTAIGLEIRLAVAIMAVLVASFAATTLDTATRLQRYVLEELGTGLGIKPMGNAYVATTAAVAVSAVIALGAGDKPGEGGFILWPLFGATNQLLAGLALMVATFYLARRSRPIAIVAVPMMLMLLTPAWAMVYDLYYDWLPNGKYVLVAFGSGILVLQFWMLLEGIAVWKRARGALEPQLAPLPEPVR